MDELSTDTLRRAIDECLDRVPSGLRVDVTGVDFLSSSGIGVLVGARNRAEARGRSLDVVAGPGSIAERVLAICGLPHSLV